MVPCKLPYSPYKIEQYYYLEFKVSGRLFVDYLVQNNMSVSLLVELSFLQSAAVNIALACCFFAKNVFLIISGH